MTEKNTNIHRSMGLAIFLGMSLITGYLLNFIFWNNLPGILFFGLQTIVVGFSLLVIMHRQEKHNWWILVPFLTTPIFAFFTVVRASPWLTAFNVLVCITLTALFFLNINKEKIREANISFWFPIETLLLILKNVTEPLEILASSISKKRKWNKTTVKHILIAAIFGFPLIYIVTGLLASSDIIFEKYIADTIENLTEWLHIEDLPELVRNFIMTGLFALGFLGVFTSLTKKETQRLYKGFAPETRRTSFYSIAIVLAVILGIFIAIQIRYLFLGAEDVLYHGYTYALYARRGFYQLLWVAAITFTLSLLITKKTGDEPVLKRSKILACILTTETFVLLISAMKRILLYIEVYNWTEKRFFGLIGMIVLCGILIAFLVQILSKKSIRNAYVSITLFSLAALVIILNILNPDAIIARKNIDAYKNGAEEYEFDFDYTSYISADAAFAGLELFDAARTEKEQWRAAEAIDTASIELFNYKKQASEHWYKIHFSNEKAYTLLQTRQQEIQQFLINTRPKFQDIPVPTTIEL